MPLTKKAREVSSTSCFRRSKKAPAAREPQLPAHEPPEPAPADAPLSPSPKSREVQELREYRDQLLRDKEQEEQRAARERVASSQKVQSLERELAELELRFTQERRKNDLEQQKNSDFEKEPDSPTAGATSYVALSPGDTAVSKKQLWGVFAVIGVESALLVGFAIACAVQAHGLSADGAALTGLRHDDIFWKKRSSHVSSDLEDTRELLRQSQSDLRQARAEAERWEERFNQSRADNLRATRDINLARPYNMITGLKAHVAPEMAGKVAEKTIWAYWYHPKNCPWSGNCVLPPVVQLCKETIEQNRGGFDFKVVHMDEVPKYVNLIELPMRWKQLAPAQQKDSLMNALLARYGGVAMDISTILLRPLDDHWDEMVRLGATFRGYMYRINGEPWRHAETTCVWFLMARREGIFSSAVRSQVIGMGDRNETGAYHHWYLALGDQTLTPILHLFNYSLPTCMDDPVIRSPPAAAVWDQKASMCPEQEQRGEPAATGPARSDAGILLRDPRDGPQLPFAFGVGMAVWNVTDDEPFTEAQIPSNMRVPGAPMQSETCSSPKECWEVFLQRYHAPAKFGQAGLLDFVKLFAHAQELEGKSRREMLSANDTYFARWMNMAGVAE